DENYCIIMHSTTTTGEDPCTYTVLSLTHRRGFQADWLFFNKMCYFIFCNTSGEKQIFPL
ncbi:hypothetical protein, partial [Salmonella enterica]|uniref:hypothetical protein n=1 Tax=Salmonella enterica TaxID=28901 RepID=UPI003EDB8BC4